MCCAPGIAGADGNWPQFRGPNCQGVQDEAKPPAQLEGAHSASWSTPLPSGVSSPCVWGGRVFVTGFDPARKQLETLCVEANTGSILCLP